MNLGNLLAFGHLALVVGSAYAQHPVDGRLTPTEDAARLRAPDLFNAAHDAMRQWGSSNHHNGMSFFLATVPEGVLLHHGNARPETPVDPDWLAFEIEHAEMFARSRFSGPPPGSSPGHDDGERGRLRLTSLFQGPERPQRPLGQGPGPAPSEDNGGWLHVYRTTRPLKLLYIDGMSAGKTNMGTLDTQDYILRDMTPDESGQIMTEVPGPRPPGGPMGESRRAEELCKLCKEWGLQGVIRMETGFEIIKCDFSDGMEKLQVTHRPGAQGGRGPSRGPGRSPGRGPFGGDLEFLRGIAERYDGIGSSRAVIDFSSMVSAFYFPVNLSNPDPERQDLPRLINATESELSSIKAYLSRVIEERSQEPAAAVDWQGVSDMIVSRYADRLRYMTQKVTSVSEMARETAFILRLFINDLEDDEDLAAATSRCTSFYLPPISNAAEIDSLLHIAFTSVTNNICTTLFRVRQLLARDGVAEGQSLEDAVQALQGLMDYLGWARFKKCEACGIGEVCFIPMWPMGKVEDYFNPRCTNGTDMRAGESYWGGFQHPRPDAPAN